MLDIVPLAARPDLEDAMWELPSTWPTFMTKDPNGKLFVRMPELFPEHQLLAVDDGELIGRVFAAPFRWSGEDDDLPVRGWDAILERAAAENAAGQRPNAVSLLEARVAPGRQGAGLSAQLLTAAREHVVRLGMRDLFGPVRPTAKCRRPRMPMAEYVTEVRDDGLPTDPWLRVHVRLGARIVAVCPLSMTIPGTLAQWREWTGLPFDRSGLVEVPEALTPVHVSLEQNHAVYIEPNVWLHHRC